LEAGRTTHNKTVDDFLSITRLPKNTKICFLDDLYHEEMDTDNVFYLHVKPYEATIPFHIMAEKYYNTYQDQDQYQDKEAFIRFVVNNMNKYNIDVSHETNQKYEANKEISNEILASLKNFLKIPPKRKTRNNKRLKNRVSHKVR